MNNFAPALFDELSRCSSVYEKTVIVQQQNEDYSQKAIDSFLSDIELPNRSVSDLPHSQNEDMESNQISKSDMMLSMTKHPLDQRIDDNNKDNMSNWQVSVKNGDEEIAISNEEANLEVQYECQTNNSIESTSLISNNGNSFSLSQ